MGAKMGPRLEAVMNNTRALVNSRISYQRRVGRREGTGDVLAHGFVGEHVANGASCNTESCRPTKTSDKSEYEVNV